jgi:hypothetical protein
MALKIVGSGFGRTGTYSLKAALEQLGFGPCHHMSEVIGSPDQIAGWAEAANGAANYEKIFRDFSSAVDFPISAFWQDVLEVNPDAKVILSYRDAEDWYDSFSQTILPLVLDKAAWPENARPWFEMMDAVIIGKAFGGRTDRDSILAAYRANEAAVRAVGSDKALVVHAREGWGPLCKFLGVDVPSEPYPKTNARADFFSSVKSGTTATAD